MADILTIKLSKTPGTSWGIRLHGGKDFASPLCIQKVNPGSIAENAGLKSGDILLSIAGTDSGPLRHKEAQDVIMNSGNNFDVAIQRGGQIWKPSVTPLPEPRILPGGVPVATKTSLAANPKSVQYIGRNHNIIPKPYPGSPLINNRSSPSTQPTNTEMNMRNIFNSMKKSPIIDSVHDASFQKDESFKSEFSSYISKNDFSDLKISGTDISIDKEKARNFLLLSIDKENVDLAKSKSKDILDGDSNILKSKNSFMASTPSKASRSSSSSSIEHVKEFGLVKDGPSNRVRKSSYSSNCSSLSNPSSFDGDADCTNCSQNSLAPATYNSPINLYSDENIRQTLSAHAEVLDKDKGVVGVNFMKNEKAYDGQTSDVLRMVQEMDLEPREASRTPTDLMGHHSDTVQSHSFNLLRRTLGDEDELVGSDRCLSPITRSVEAPKTNPVMSEGGHPEAPTHCLVCDRPIIGVFVRVKGKNMHADCFKCCTCGSSLKNAGYYSINEKLYCDIHAKQAARNNPPAPHLEPVTVPPGRPIPPGSMTSMQAMTKQNFSSYRQTNGTGNNSGPVPFTPGYSQSVPSYSSPVPAPVSAPVPAPAPAPFMPSSNFSPMESPFATAPKTSFSPSFTSSFNSGNPQGFGAPAGNINVKSHIPKRAY